MMIKAIKIAGIISLGVIFGIASALWMSGLIGGKGIDSFADVNAGGWGSDWAIGSAAADPYLRARIARHGLLALSKQEAVYFVRKVDDEGNALRPDCRYKLSGGGQDAMWWSITLYDKDSRLPMNTDNALSIDATKVGDADNWSAIIAPEKPKESGFWISSAQATQFDLMLRIYRPSQSVLNNPQVNVNAPNIRRVDCRVGANS
jgi:hypothetical protein